MIRAYAVVALGLLVAGCSGGSSSALKPAVTPSAAATSAEPTATVSPAPVSSPTPTASPLLTTDFGYFPAVLSASGQVRLSFDRAYFLTGDAAVKAAKAHGQEVENDYYIQNDNALRRPVTLAADARVFGSLQLNTFAGQDDTVDLKPRTVKELLGFLATSAGKGCGFHLRYDTHGLVTRVEEQYVP